MRLLRYAAPAVLLALAACSGGNSTGGPAASIPGTDSPRKLIQATYARTTSAKTARIYVRFRISLPDVSDAPTQISNGVEDFTHRSFAMTDTEGPFESRIIGDDRYFHVPKEAMGGPAPYTITKPWVHLHGSPSHANNTAGLAHVLDSIDPAQFVQLLTKVSSSVTRVGMDLVRGQQSTHFRMTFDAAKVAALDASLGDCDKNLAASDATTPLDVWLDAQGRLTRLTVTTKPFSAKLSTPTNAPNVYQLQQGSPDVTTTIELYDYGLPVTVMPPPADQTQDLHFPAGSPGTPTPCPTS